MNRLLLWVLLAPMLLSGCATMSPDECRVADWYLIGEMDARSGRTPSHFANRERACREAGFPADQHSWREGWEFGLSIFCTAQQGFRFGRDGGRYEPICPAALESDFLGGYDLGRQSYLLAEQIDELRTEIRSLEREIREGSRSGSLNDDQLDELRQERAHLQAGLRDNELQWAELTGRARGLRLLD